jgi:metal-responsive CopG/Arc/MetJ family transcriptional regulator
MSKNRIFNETPKTRLIVSMETSTVEKIDELTRRGHPAKGNRSEFVRLAVEEKLERDVVRFQDRVSAAPPIG